MKYLFLSKSFHQKPIAGHTPFDKNEDCYLYYKEDLFKQFGDTGILIDGYIMPRQNYFNEWKESSQFELVYKLYKKHGSELIRFLKGIFSIIIVEKDKTLIFNDHLGLNKIFIYVKASRFAISDDYKTIVSFIDEVELDYNAIAINSFFHHFLNGDTFIKQIKYLNGSTKLIVDKGRISEDIYWDYKSLMNDTIQTLSYEESAANIKSILFHYTSYLAPDKLALSLTGGKDCRTILAGLLSQDLKPYTFTYGNENSKDAFYAGKIAKGTGVEYEIIMPDNSLDWYENVYDQIIRMNDPLINVHRAHRYHSFSKLRLNLGENTMLFGGYMGGEILMGLYYDDLIFTSFLRKYWEENMPIHKLVEENLAYNFINPDKIQMDELISTITNYSFINEKEIRKQHFHAAFEIGFLHHSQDINLAMEQMRYAVPLFMDIDLLELIFQSEFNLLYQDNKTNNIYQRYKLFDFNLNIQHVLYPDLDQYNFAKKGYFNTKEFLGNKTILTLLRAFRYYTDKQKFSPTYTYGKNYVDYIQNNLIKIRNSNQDDINDLFNLNSALKGVENKAYGSQEKHWHRYSNIVMMDKFVSHYLN
jgi:hypothetical protein